MAVQPGPTFKRYAANGAATVYTIPFLLLDPANLQITLNGVAVTSGFTLAGLGNASSSCTFTVAPAGDLLFQQVMQFQRLTDYQMNGDFLSQTVNGDYDRLWLAIKQLNRDDGRALAVSPLEPEGIPALPVRALRNLKLLAFDAAGNPAPSNLTLLQLEQQPALALASAAEAKAFADESSESAARSGEEADRASDFAVNAEDAAASSASSASIASAISNPFTNTADGIVATAGSGATNRFFSVPILGDSRALSILYRNDVGTPIEIGRTISEAAVDNVLGQISQSNGSSSITASAADADGFEVLQLQEDGLLRTVGFEIGPNGFETQLLALQNLDLPNVSSDVIVIDLDGFHYSLDPVAQAVAETKSVPVLFALWVSLSNELEDVLIRLVGDSITWGMTVTGGGAQDPRAHALTDPRNNLSSPSWANLLHQYLGVRYSSGVMSSPAPGVALYEAPHTIDVTTSGKVSVINFSTREVVDKTVIADASAALEALCVVPDGHALCFDTVGTGFTLVYRESPGAGSFTVLVDGMVDSTVTTANAATVYGKTVTLALPFGRHTVELRCTGGVSFEAIQRTRKIRVSNDGLIGTNTQEWLPNAGRLPASVSNDDTHVFVQLGTNDRALTTEPNDPVRTKRNLVAIANYITNVRGKSLVLMAANYADLDYPSMVSAKYSQADVARMIAQVASSFGCGYIDNYRATLKQKLAGQAFLADGLHPNDSGHMQIFINIVDGLEQV